MLPWGDKKEWNPPRAENEFKNYRRSFPNHSDSEKRGD
jgi:hypothetical protein